MTTSRTRLKTATKRSFSREQVNYMQAKALYETRHKAGRDYDHLMDAEGVRLGIAQPGDCYVILPEDHPMWEKAQKLLDSENAASALMYAAAHQLFDWATETTLAKIGTDQQRADIRQAVAKVKTMAHVEKRFEELVAISMQLDAR